MADYKKPKKETSGNEEIQKDEVILEPKRELKKRYKIVLVTPQAIVIDVNGCGLYEPLFPGSNKTYKVGDEVELDS